MKCLVPLFHVFDIAFGDNFRRRRGPCRTDQKVAPDASPKARKGRCQTGGKAPKDATTQVDPNDATKFDLKVDAGA